MINADGKIISPVAEINQYFNAAIDRAALPKPRCEECGDESSLTLGMCSDCYAKAEAGQRADEAFADAEWRSERGVR